MATTESQFSSEIRNDIEYLYDEKVLVDLVPDMKRTGKKKYDFYFVLYGKFFGIECKLFKGSTLNYDNDFKPHQIGSIKHVNEVGGLGFFFLCWKKYNEIHILNGESMELLLETYGNSIRYYQIFEFLNLNEVVKREKYQGKLMWNIKSWIDRHV